MAREQTAVVTGGAREIAPATGKLGVMLVGLGAVSTTFIAGVENVRRGRALPIGSIRQMATIRLGKRTEKRVPKIKEFGPLADLKDLVFTAWDPIPDDAYTAAVKAGVLDKHEHLEPIKDFLQNIKPMPAVFDQYYVKRLQGTNVKRGKNKRELAEQLREDMRNFKKSAGLDRLVVVWCASTEVFLTPGPAHQSLAAFQKAMEQNDQSIAPSMLNAYPEIYGKVYHKVRINYYPPRGDNKEGWDNIDIFGWLGYPMQIKVDFLCRDSILAAPIVLDLALFFDLAGRAGLSGIQEWLSFYFKSPQFAAGLYAEHDLFIQQTKLKNTLRWLMGEEQITHLGIEYYEYAEK